MIQLIMNNSMDNEFIQLHSNITYTASCLDMIQLFSDMTYTIDMYNLWLYTYVLLHVAI